LPGHLLHSLRLLYATIALSSRSLTSNTVNMPAATLPSSHSAAIDEVNSQISRDTRLVPTMC
jgi:hypothetical protein